MSDIDPHDSDPQVTPATETPAQEERQVVVEDVEPDKDGDPKGGGTFSYFGMNTPWGSGGFSYGGGGGS